MDQDEREVVHEVSVVVPAHHGEHTLQVLADELATLRTPQTTPGGRRYRVAELLLVHDGAVEGSTAVIRAIAVAHHCTYPVWLSRNFGPHPATLAGMAGTVSDWVVTLDAHGQQDPADIGKLLDCALDSRTRLVYAAPINAPSHGVLQTVLSTAIRRLFMKRTGTDARDLSSFRLIEGQVARGVAAYCGANVHLDVALSWVVGASRCPVKLRLERGPAPDPSTGGPVRQAWQMVLASGTAPLRMISWFGTLALLLAAVMGVYAAWRWKNQAPVEAWATTGMLVAASAGLTFLALAAIGEYLSFAVSLGMGKPAYLIVSRPRDDLGKKP
jgi:hypothetical protein